MDQGYTAASNLSECGGDSKRSNKQYLELRCQESMLNGSSQRLPLLHWIINFPCSIISPVVPANGVHPIPSKVGASR